MYQLIYKFHKYYQEYEEIEVSEPIKHSTYQTKFFHNISNYIHTLKNVQICDILSRIIECNYRFENRHFCLIIIQLPKSFSFVFHQADGRARSWGLFGIKQLGDTILGAMCCIERLAIADTVSLSSFSFLSASLKEHRAFLVISCKINWVDNYENGKEK